jgi:hypothetical protein
LKFLQFTIHLNHSLSRITLSSLIALLQLPQNMPPAAEDWQTGRSRQLAAEAYNNRQKTHQLQRESRGHFSAKLSRSPKHRI